MLNLAVRNVTGRL